MVLILVNQHVWYTSFVKKFSQELVVSSFMTQIACCCNNSLCHFSFAVSLKCPCHASVASLLVKNSEICISFVIQWIQLKETHRQYAVSGLWFVYENLPSLFAKQQITHYSKIHKSNVLFVFIGLQVPSASTLQRDYHEITSWVPLLPTGSGPTRLATGKRSHFSSKMQTFFSVSSNAKKKYFCRGWATTPFSTSITLAIHLE